MFENKWKKAYKELYAQVKFREKLIKDLMNANSEVLENASDPVKEQASIQMKFYEDQLFAYNEVRKYMKGYAIANGLDL